MIPTRTKLTETKKALRLCTLGHFSHVQLCNPVDCGLPGLSVSGVPQARILEQAAIPFQSTVSCCPNCWLPWVSGVARAPVTEAAPASPHLAFPGANPSPPGQPQEQTPVHNPHAEVEIKPQLKPTGSAAQEEDLKPPTSCTSCRLNPQSTRQRCLWNI